MARPLISLALALALATPLAAEPFATDDCAELAGNGICDEPDIGSGACYPGTDTTDCRGDALSSWAAVIDVHTDGYSAIRIYGPSSIMPDTEAQIVVQLQARSEAEFVSLMRGMAMFAVPEEVDIQYGQIRIRTPDLIEQRWISSDPFAESPWKRVSKSWYAKLGLDLLSLASETVGTLTSTFSIISTINDRLIEERLDLSQVEAPFTDLNRYDTIGVSWDYPRRRENLIEIVLPLRFPHGFDADAAPLSAFVVSETVGERDIATAHHARTVPSILAALQSRVETAEPPAEDAVAPRKADEVAAQPREPQVEQSNLGVVRYSQSPGVWTVDVPEGFSKVEVAFYGAGRDQTLAYAGWNGVFSVNGQEVWRFLRYDSAKGGLIYDALAGGEVWESEGRDRWLDITALVDEGENEFRYGHFTSGDGIGVKLRIETAAAPSGEAPATEDATTAEPGPVPSVDELSAALADSYWETRPDEDGDTNFWYFAPSGLYSLHYEVGGSTIRACRGSRSWEFETKGGFTHLLAIYAISDPKCYGGTWECLFPITGPLGDVLEGECESDPYRLTRVRLR